MLDHRGFHGHPVVLPRVEQRCTPEYVRLFVLVILQLTIVAIAAALERLVGVPLAILGTHPVDVITVSLLAIAIGHVFIY